MPKSARPPPESHASEKSKNNFFVVDVVLRDELTKRRTANDLTKRNVFLLRALIAKANIRSHSQAIAAERIIRGDNLAKCRLDAHANSQSARKVNRRNPQAQIYPKYLLNYSAIYSSDEREKKMRKMQSVYSDGLAFFRRFRSPGRATAAERE